MTTDIVDQAETALVMKAQEDTRTDGEFKRPWLQESHEKFGEVMSHIRTIKAKDGIAAAIKSADETFGGGEALVELSDAEKHIARKMFGDRFIHDKDADRKVAEAYLNSKRGVAADGGHIGSKLKMQEAVRKARGW